METIRGSHGPVPKFLYEDGEIDPDGLRTLLQSVPRILGTAPVYPVSLVENITDSDTETLRTLFGDALGSGLFRTIAGLYFAANVSSYPLNLADPDKARRLITRIEDSSRSSGLTKCLIFFIGILSAYCEMSAVAIRDAQTVAEANLEEALAWVNKVRVGLAEFLSAHFMVTNSPATSEPSLEATLRSHPGDALKASP